jgi:hypothetical protein
MGNDATEAVPMAQDPHDAGGPPGPAAGDEKVSVSWLILQRLEDLRQEIGAVKAEQDALRGTLRQEIGALRAEQADLRTELRQEIGALRAEQAALRSEVRAEIQALRDDMDRRFAAVDRRFAAMEQRWTWALGLVLVMALGLLAKLLIPGA